MTDTVETEPETAAAERAVARERHPPQRGLSWRMAAVAVACAVLGFLLVAQVRATEGVGERLAAEREEDLARILSELSAQSDRLQSEVTELRLHLVEFETSVEAEELALRSLQRRFDDLNVLVGALPAEGPGLVLTIDDPERAVTQDLLVDTVQELRDAGAEAIAVNDIRLLASSAFAVRNDRLVLDRQPLDPPYRVAAIGPGETMEPALGIPGGAIDALEVTPGVRAETEVRSDVALPAASEVPSFVYATPLVGDDEQADASR